MCLIRELLEGSGHDFSIVKVLNVGVYHYRFVVDGQWTFAPDLPHERDNVGNEFNILELKVCYISYTTVLFFCFDLSGT